METDKRLQEYLAQNGEVVNDAVSEGHAWVKEDPQASPTLDDLVRERPEFNESEL